MQRDAPEGCALSGGAASNELCETCLESAAGEILDGFHSYCVVTMVSDMEKALASSNTGGVLP